jgi:two-component system, NarL family, nitrate/nitrite response regulator NarL
MAAFSTEPARVPTNGARDAMRILLADDHDLVRDSLELLLQRLDPGLEVMHAASLPEALTRAAAEPDVDLVMLDVNMPGMNRVAGVEAMARTLPDVPIVVISGLFTHELAIDALRAGAAGFIPKTMAGRTMLGAIELVLSGERYIPPQVIEGSVVTPAVASATQSLSRREREVLQLLAGGLSNKEIARRLGVETVTVAVHLSSIYRKLGAANRTQAARIALEHGISPAA